MQRVCNTLTPRSCRLPASDHHKAPAFVGISITRSKVISVRWWIWTGEVILNSHSIEKCRKMIEQVSNFRSSALPSAAFMQPAGVLSSFLSYYKPRVNYWKDAISAAAASGELDPHVWDSCERDGGFNSHSPLTLMDWRGWLYVWGVWWFHHVCLCVSWAFVSTRRRACVGMDFRRNKRANRRLTPAPIHTRTLTQQKAYGNSRTAFFLSLFCSWWIARAHQFWITQSMTKIDLI